MIQAVRPEGEFTVFDLSTLNAGLSKTPEEKRRGNNYNVIHWSFHFEQRR
jgi:hypothetical protein